MALSDELEPPTFEDFTKEEVLTIIGIKVLQNLFKEDKAKWKFVVQKSKKFLKKDNIDELIDEFEINEYKG